MTRKSKQPGGHNPLTYNETRKLDYGTTTTRLGTASKQRFGDCCLSLVPAKDPVATPSGHIYSLEAILSYLLQHTQHHHAQRKLDDARRVQRLDQDAHKLSKKRQKMLDEFEKTNYGPAQLSTEEHGLALRKTMDKMVDTETTEIQKKTLRRTSYWLSECQPKEQDTPIEPPKRVASPMSGRPLRRKELVSLSVAREPGWDTGDHGCRCLCALTHKAITTQPVVLLKKSGVVLLEEAYKKFVLEEGGEGKKTLRCPITGSKFRHPRDVLVLQKGTSGFAASGDVVAKKYRPTLT